jgi:hypothetical protein
LQEGELVLAWRDGEVVPADAARMAEERWTAQSRVLRMLGMATAGRDRS